MPLFYVDDEQMHFLQTIINHLENIPSLDAKAEKLQVKGLFHEENSRTALELQIEDIISDVEQEDAITINYTKSDLESIASSVRHYDNSGLYDSIEEAIRAVLL